MKLIDLNSNEYKISNSEILKLRVSQCVGVGIIDKKNKKYGLTHIHYKNNYEKLLDSLLKGLNSKNQSINNSNLEIIVCGGINSFIPYYGPIFGEKTAKNVLSYLKSKKLEKNIIKLDIFGDYIRELFLYPNLNYQLKVYSENTLDLKA